MSAQWSEPHPKRGIGAWMEAHLAATVISGLALAGTLVWFLLAITSRNPGSLTLVWFFTTLATLGSLIPGIIATIRDTANETAVWLITTLLGWTIIGWIGALIWAVVDKTPEQRRREELTRAHESAQIMAAYTQRPRDI